MLAIPVGGQFEQVINARYLQRLGYGRACAKLDDPDELAQFLAEVPACAEHLRAHVQDGNKLILDEVDHLLDCAAAGIL
jgi:UDP:flavonoid glycosyltransferase YjiC (YdhE family)